jgi:hypothetical protein
MADQAISRNRLFANSADEPDPSHFTNCPIQCTFDLMAEN